MYAGETAAPEVHPQLDDHPLQYLLLVLPPDQLSVIRDERTNHRVFDYTETVSTAFASELRFVASIVGDMK